MTIPGPSTIRSGWIETWRCFTQDNTEAADVATIQTCRDDRECTRKAGLNRRCARESQTQACGPGSSDPAATTSARCSRDRIQLAWQCWCGRAEIGFAPTRSFPL